MNFAAPPDSGRHAENAPSSFTARVGRVWSNELQSAFVALHSIEERQ